jgi:hypothetical protein
MVYTGFRDMIALVNVSWPPLDAALHQDGQIVEDAGGELGVREGSPK